MTSEFGEPLATVQGTRVSVSAPLRCDAGSARLGWIILDPATGATIEDSARADLPQQGNAEIVVELPEDDGTYRVLIALVEENVAWYHDRGGDCIFVDAEVGSGVAQVLSLRRVTATARRRERMQQVLTRAFVYPFRALWQNRSLISSMVRRDIHGRYRGSVAGLFWTVINPLLMMATYFVVFAMILKARMGSDNSPLSFLMYFIAGMLPWLAFNEAVGRSPSVVLEHRTLVKRVVFPIEILPLNLMVSGLVSEFFGTIVFLVVVLAIRHGLPLTAVYLPLILIPQVLFTAGLCWFLAGVGVFLRDTGQFVAFFMTLWFFATPICYEAPKGMERLFAINPIYVLVRSYRAVLLDGVAPPWRSLAWLTALGFSAFILGFAWFYKSRKAFPDVL